MIPPGSEAITATFASLDATTIKDPPFLAIIQAVQAPNPTDKLELSVTFSKTNRLDHVELYFTEPLDPTATRSFNINVNNEFAYAISPMYRQCDGVWINAMSVDTLNIELIPMDNSTEPPVISAIEVYTASDPLTAVYTSKDDHISRDIVLMVHFQILAKWMPRKQCNKFLPSNEHQYVLLIVCLMHSTVFPSCFHLLNNSLDGSIPDFLGKLPNPRLLDLHDNNFVGGVPQRLVTWIQISPTEGKRLALIIGLAVGLPIFLAFITALVYFLARNQKTSAQGEVTPVELGSDQGGTATGQPQDGVVSATMGSETLIRPSLSIELHASSVSNGDSFTTDPSISHIPQLPLANDDPGAMSTVEMGVSAEPPFMQIIENEELDDLLRRHGQN
ncbi:hypothetical protein DITRI_Ditri14bG0075900 [Diplodiscus trichospermus]